MKGGALSSIIILLSITSTALIVVLTGGEAVEQTITYHTNDYVEIAEAELRAASYNRRITKETNYSVDHAALEIGSTEQRYVVGKIKDKNRLKKNLKDRLISKTEIKLRDKAELRYCQGPKPKILLVTNLDQGLSITLRNTPKRVKCEYKSGYVKIPVKESFKIINTRNQFINLTNAQINISKESEEKLKNYEWQNITEKVRTKCYEGGKFGSINVEALALNRVIKKLKRDRKDNFADIAKKIKKNLNLANFISVEKGTTNYEVGFNISNKEANACQKKGSIKESVDGNSYNLEDFVSSSGSLSKTASQKFDKYQKDCNQANNHKMKEAEDSDLNNFVSNPSEYVPTDACYKMIQGEKGSAKATMYIKSVRLDFVLTDTENKIYGINGKKRKLSSEFRINRTQVYTQGMF